MGRDKAGPHVAASVVVCHAGQPRGAFLPSCEKAEHRPAVMSGHSSHVVDILASCSIRVARRVLCWADPPRDRTYGKGQRPCPFIFRAHVAGPDVSVLLSISEKERERRRGEEVNSRIPARQRAHESRVETCPPGRWFPAGTVGAVHHPEVHGGKGTEHGCRRSGGNPIRVPYDVWNLEHGGAQSLGNEPPVPFSRKLATAKPIIWQQAPYCGAPAQAERPGRWKGQRC